MEEKRSHVLVVQANFYCNSTLSLYFLHYANHSYETWPSKRLACCKKRLDGDWEAHSERGCAAADRHLTYISKLILDLPIHLVAGHGDRGDGTDGYFGISEYWDSLIDD